MLEVTVSQLPWPRTLEEVLPSTPHCETCEARISVVTVTISREDVPLVECTLCQRCARFLGHKLFGMSSVFPGVRHLEPLR